MKLKTRIAVITMAVLSICCLLLFVWNATSTSTMMNNIRLLEPLQTPTDGAHYARLTALEQQETSNQLRLLAGLGMVVILGSVLSYLAATFAMRPILKLTKTIQTFRTSDLKSELPLPKIKDESYELIRAFNEMIVRLNGSFEREKRISANIAHEFRTPLSVLLTKYEVLEMKQTESVEDYKKVIAVSKEKVEYLAKITSDLLTLYRKTHDVHNQPFDLAQLLCEITEDYSAPARDKQISLHLDCPQITILADRLLFAQMLRNFIENAIKYNVPNGQIRILAETKGTVLNITIQDSGIGIPEEEKPYIFEPFYRIEDSRNKHYGGTGLGLALAKEVIQLYRGNVTVADALVSGSIFTLTFPDIVM